MKEKIKKDILENIKMNEIIIEDCLFSIEEAASTMIDCIKNSGKIMWCGNGGSAADAQHLATELMGGMGSHDRKPIPSVALTTDSSFLTAWSNDTDFESIFSRQVQGIGQSGDSLVGITTSGNSGNVIAAVKQAKFKNIETIVFTGESGGMIKDLANTTIFVPSNNTQRIQEAHIMIGQIICGLIEESLLN